MVMKASESLLRMGHVMTWAPFMTSREAVLKDVMLSTTLLSPMTVNTIDDMMKTIVDRSIFSLKLIDRKIFSLS